MYAYIYVRVRDRKTPIMENYFEPPIPNTSEYQQVFIKDTVKTFTYIYFGISFV